MSSKSTHIKLIEKGIAHLSDNDTLSALSCFDKAFVIGKTPELLSYLSYCMAKERGQIYEALKLCDEALSQEPENPVHYLNLGRIYLHAGNKKEAVLTLRKGLSFGENQTIKSILEKIGTRRKPILPFLPRNSFLNKYAGILLNRLKLR